MLTKTLGTLVAGALVMSGAAVVLTPALASSNAGASSSVVGAPTSSAGATETTSVTAKPKGGKKKYRPPKGGLFNNPMGRPAARFRIERHILKAIRHTPKGERIRIAAYSLDRPPVADALIAAHRRGVKVQVLLNDHIVPAAQRRIASFLGRNTKKANFLYRCTSGCRAQKTEYNNLHSKFYLFSKTGKAENVVMLGSANLTLNAVRWQWNDLWTGRDKEVLYDHFVALFNEMRKDYNVRQPYYMFCDEPATPCDWTVSKYFNHVFPKVSTPQDDVVMNILNGVQCRYVDATGKERRTVLRLSMHTMRGVRGDYLAEKIRSLYAAGCDFKVLYGLMGFYTKQAIGAPTARGRIPLRSTGFDLDPDVVEESIDEVERYTHQKYVTIRGSWMGNTATNIVFTGSSNWASLGTPQDEIIFSIRGTSAVRRWNRNWNLMWRKPYSRDAYTTTYSNFRTFTEVDGRLVPQVIRRKVVTVQPDNLVGAGPTWEGD
jgi:phosphatidylserine/phosphatidylglycerophosphate/cardiolipin synthase-like enzyme